MQLGFDDDRCCLKPTVSDAETQEVAAGQLQSGLIERPRVEVVVKHTAGDCDGDQRTVVGELRVMKQQTVVGELAVDECQLGVGQQYHCRLVVTAVTVSH